MTDSFLLNPQSLPLIQSLLFLPISSSSDSAAASGLHPPCHSSAVLAVFNHHFDHSSFLILWWLPNVLYVAKLSSPQASEHFKENHTSFFSPSPTQYMPKSAVTQISSKFLSLVSTALALDSELFPKYHFAIGNPLFSQLIMQTLNYSFRDSIAAIVFSENPSLLNYFASLFQPPKLYFLLMNSLNNTQCFHWICI